MNNAELQAKYDEMHEQGKAAWFSNGAEERREILRVGSPWDRKAVLEIGCGEGELAESMLNWGASVVVAQDYSEVALRQAKRIRAGNIQFTNTPYRELVTGATPFNRVVMQGVLEHMDKPWEELSWILEHLVQPGGDIITSSPCFYNVRGIVWMTLATLFDAKMSLTDLHFLHPRDFDGWGNWEPFCKSVKTYHCDFRWGNTSEMVRDLNDRLPKVFPGMELGRIAKFTSFLEELPMYSSAMGATAVYRIRRK